MSPFLPASVADHPDAHVEITMKIYGISREAARKMLDDEEKRTEYWLNDKYQVAVEKNYENKSFHINIRRRDGRMIRRDWREFQQIKNELIGPEYEAIELYPAEDRLVDTSNKYHLWGILDPTFRFPFGWNERDTESVNALMPGMPGYNQREP